MWGQVALDRATLDAHDDVCPVCRGDFSDPDTEAIRWLGAHPGAQPCGHIMHRDCLVTAAEAAHTCPVCRAPVAADAAVASGVIQQVVRRIPRPAQLLTTWPPMGVAMLRTAAARHIPTIVHWLAHTANVGGEQGDGGASPLLVPLLHHALRRCAYPLPNGVHLAQSEGGRVIEEAFRHVSTNSGMDADNLVNRSEQWTQACDFAYQAVRRYWDEHGRETFDNRMQGLEAWPPCHGSGDPDAAAEVTVAMREDGYIARRAQDAILGCPAGAAFQHAALLVTQLVADHRPAPVRAPAPVQQPRDEAGLIIDANNAAYAAAEAADLAAQAAPPPGAARDAARAERATQYRAGAAREAARVAEANAAADAITDAVIAAPNAWRHLVGGGNANGAVATAGAEFFRICP